MAWIRWVRIASGATAVQFTKPVGGRRRILEHVGSAHTEAELGFLLERARMLLDDLDVGVEPTPACCASNLTELDGAGLGFIVGSG